MSALTVLVIAWCAVLA